MSDEALALPSWRGLEFIVNTTPHPPDQKQQRLIRSHASRNKAQRRNRVTVKSWIQHQSRPGFRESEDSYAIPRNIGTSLSLMDFPEPLKPYMQEDVARSLVGMKESLYPPQICLQVDPKQSSWTANLLTDVVYLHCTIYAVEAYIDAHVGRPQSTLTQFHFAKTLRLLQERLNSVSSPEAISDSTIMVIAVLGLTSELVGDAAAAGSHIKGLGKMVGLRGGLKMLAFENPRLPAKVCRVDLCLALRFGTKPVFFYDELCWDAYVADVGLVRRQHTTLADTKQSDVPEFVKTLDPRLGNVWRDLWEFCFASNLASQTPYKLRPNTFSEIMVSALYRLLNLSFPGSPVEDAFRLGMIVFAATIFFQWREIRDRQGYLNDSLRTALLKVQECVTNPPPKTMLWLLAISSLGDNEGCSDEVLGDWMEYFISHCLHLYSWIDMRETLKEVLWIDSLFDDLGEAVYSSGIARKDRTTPCGRTSNILTSTTQT